MGWLIVAQKGIAAGQTFSLDRTPFSFGRNSDNRVVLAEGQVSRYHAEIRQEQGGYTIYDLDSSNGTRVNSELVLGQRLLHDHDLITISKNLFQVVSAAEPVPGDETYPRLLHLKSGEPPLFVFLAQLPLTLGRDGKNAVCIKEKQVSRFHAVIKETPDGLAITDLSSCNGTLVNKERVQPSHLLKHNDRLEIGGETLIFLDGPVSLLNQGDQPQAQIPPVTALQYQATQAARLQSTPFQTPPPQLAPLPPVPVNRLAQVPLQNPSQLPAFGAVEYGIRCPGRCGRTWPLHIEHCPIDGYLLANGHSVLLDAYNGPWSNAS